MTLYQVIAAIVLFNFHIGPTETCTSTSVNHIPPTPPTPMGCKTCPADVFLRTTTITDNADGCMQITIYCAMSDQEISFNNGAIDATERGQITLQCGDGGWVYNGQVVTEATCTPV
ncbi:unnamed protein product [Bursaphelenchus xylophilus]|uniref:(pine wood nematode) hypothetical protein n=1 Tax=Bursaphelenchus xylophilus TaxID=6326 RepID=A0A1I7SF38_BURXY|nr:unnamed protein product [Bursaphelenchus xylophilus]CAG9078872.1 unnamed protein product [Bursaphelenchus xylophilus]